MRTNLVLLTTTFFFFSTQNAYAYLDPGTGSMMLQAMIGVIASGMFFIRLYWDKFRAFTNFGSGSKSAKAENKTHSSDD